MSPEDFAVLDLMRCELRLRARQAVTLPGFLGSTLRGAFGHALKEAVCLMDHRNCEHCLLADRCLYPYLFETRVPPGIPQLRGQKQAPHPFILTAPMLSDMTAMSRPSIECLSSRQPISRLIPVETMRPQVTTHSLADGRSVRLVRSPAATLVDGHSRFAKGDDLKFELVLIGRAVEYLPYVVFAVSEMARRGLGAERAPFELIDVAAIDQSGTAITVYSGKSRRISVPPSAIINLSDLVRARLDQLKAAGLLCGDRLRLKFLTPTRIRVDRDLQTGLSFELLVRNLLRRVSMLAAVHGRAPLELDSRGLIERAGRVITRESSLRWFDWERYSNRQMTKMALGGFVGEIEYADEHVGSSDLS